MSANYGSTPIPIVYADIPDARGTAVVLDSEAAGFYAPPLEELETIARMRLTRSLTATECREFLHLDQCPSD